MMYPTEQESSEVRASRQIAKQICTASRNEYVVDVHLLGGLFSATALGQSLMRTRGIGSEVGAIRDAISNLLIEEFGLGDFETPRKSDIYSVETLSTLELSGALAKVDEQGLVGANHVFAAVLQRAKDPCLWLLNSLAIDVESLNQTINEV